MLPVHLQWTYSLSDQILTVTLEESDVFAAWIAVKEPVDGASAGNNNELVDLKGTLPER